MRSTTMDEPRPPRDATAAGVPTRAIASRDAFQDALREAVAAMARRRSREAWFVDEDFADWPLGERAVVDALAQWAAGAGGCRLVVIARHYDAIVRHHPRWVDWRRRWAHAVECRALDDTAGSLALPGLLLVPGCTSVERTDARRQRATISSDPMQWLAQREWTDAVSQRCMPAFAATLLGL